MLKFSMAGFHWACVLAKPNTRASEAKPLNQHCDLNQSKKNNNDLWWGFWSQLAPIRSKTVSLARASGIHVRWRATEHCYHIITCTLLLQVVSSVSGEMYSCCNAKIIERARYDLNSIFCSGMRLRTMISLMDMTRAWSCSGSRSCFYL